MNCNGKGDCDKNGKCVCHAGYSGDDCSTRYVVHGEILDEAKGIVECYHGYGGPDCNTKLCRSNCSHRGICVQGTCYCKPSWTGDHCQHAACPNECYYKGECKLGVCKCDEGYRGVDCSRRHVENGVCHVATGECECNKVAEKGAAFKGQMWTGESCNHKTCLNNCTNSKHGTCNGKLGVCECDPDWMGISCEKHACPYACHGNGLCKEGTCECNDMWGGEACEQRLYWCPLDCNKNGDCVKKTNKNGTATHSCKCNALPEKVVGGKRLTAMFPGQKYKGSTCAELSCPLGPKGNECSGKGVCSKGKCTCNNLFGGKACQLSVCKDD
jgi:syndecan 4